MMVQLAKNPLSTSPLSMDGKWAKPSTLIMGPHTEGINRVEAMTTTSKRDLMSSTRPIEITLEACIEET
jgi:hypothetical protein